MLSGSVLVISQLPYIDDCMLTLTYSLIGQSPLSYLKLSLMIIKSFLSLYLLLKNYYSIFFFYYYKIFDLPVNSLNFASQLSCYCFAYDSSFLKDQHYCSRCFSAAFCCSKSYYSSKFFIEYLIDSCSTSSTCFYKRRLSWFK